jgi:hypothetical protein
MAMFYPPLEPLAKEVAKLRGEIVFKLHYTQALTTGGSLRPANLAQLPRRRRVFLYVDEESTMHPEQQSPLVLSAICSLRAA